VEEEEEEEDEKEEEAREGDEEVEGKEKENGESKGNEEAEGEEEEEEEEEEKLKGRDEGIEPRGGGRCIVAMREKKCLTTQPLEGWIEFSRLNARNLAMKSAFFDAFPKVNDKIANLR